jgi:DNA integrity scanning protein DisA with diadenylate cyclase activity
MADLRHLKRELEREFRLLGIAPSDVLWSESCLKELNKCLRPEIHEGKIPSYGAVIGGQHHITPTQARFVRLEADQLKLGRSAADGVHSFTLFDVNGFNGLLILDLPATDELTLVNLRESTGSTILTRDAEGTTRIFLQTGIAIQRHRRWSFRPAVDLILERLQKTCPCVEQPAFGAVLRFAFHQLSPLKSGATLIWCLEEPTSSDFRKMQPAVDLRHLQISVMDEAVLPAMRHLLAHVDGATIISPEGLFIGTGAQLQPSIQSKELVPEHKGTRHTSARRFSFDFEAAIVVAVSTDGTVSIFSDGASVADIRTIPTDSAAELLRGNNPSSAGAVRCFHQSCPGCGKTCVVETRTSEVLVSEHGVRCPVCNHVLISLVDKAADIYVRKTISPEHHVIKRRRA